MDAAQRNRLSSQLKYRFNITLVEYEAILAGQGGVCAICGSKPGKIRLAVDHSHDCCPGRRSCGNCIRGLLDKKCNFYLLGRICDETRQGSGHALEVLQRATDYLKRERISSDSTVEEPENPVPG